MECKSLFWREFRFLWAECQGKGGHPSFEAEKELRQKGDTQLLRWKVESGTPALWVRSGPNGRDKLRWVADGPRMTSVEINRRLGGLGVMGPLVAIRAISQS